jgi:hypothetical protein
MCSVSRIRSIVRAAYLDRACADAAGLRQRVEELLKASEESSACLDDPSVVSPRPGGTIRLNPTPTEKSGDRIGRYKLLQEIGEGGGGVVYMAEQQETPFAFRTLLQELLIGCLARSRKQFRTIIASVQLIKALGGGWEQQQIFASAMAINSQPSTENKK